MNLLNVNFRELYERHLCRHSQYGINVAHLAAVTATYVAVFQVIRLLSPDLPTAVALSIAGSAAYLLIVQRNLPQRPLMATGVFLAAVLAVTFATPAWPWWVPPLVIVAAHLAQNLSHRYYDHASDMTAFHSTYRKGPALTALLTLYELPILLNYLVFGREDWRA